MFPNSLRVQKTATAVAYCKRGRGLIRVNGKPLDQIEPKVLQYKLQEPILLLGKVNMHVLNLVPFSSRVLFVQMMIPFSYPEIDVP